MFYFRKEVKNILKALAHLDFKSEYGQLIPLIIVATIPTGIIGLLYAKFLEDTLQTFLIIGITFLIGATILYTSRIGKENIDTITITIALIMGAAQGLATFPGLSRSGITISTALLLGLKREKAFKFSFLLSIPAIIGDLAVEAYNQRGQFALQTISPIELLSRNSRSNGCRLHCHKTRLKLGEEQEVPLLRILHLDTRNNANRSHTEWASNHLGLALQKLRQKHGELAVPLVDLGDFLVD